MARSTTNDDDSRTPNGTRALALRIACGIVTAAALTSAVGMLNLWRNDSLRAAEIGAIKAQRTEDQTSQGRQWAAIEKRLDGIDTKLSTLTKDVGVTQTQVQIIRTVLDRIEKGAP